MADDVRRHELRRGDRGGREERLDQLRLVDRQRYRLPHAHIVERLVRPVDAQEADVERRPRVDRQVGVGLRGRNVVGRQVVHAIHGPRAQLQEARGRLLDDAVGEGLQRRLLAPVVLVALQGDVVAVGPTCTKPERPGADRVADQVAAAIVLADVGRAAGAEGGEGEFLEEGGVGVVEGEANGTGIRGIDRSDQTVGSRSRRSHRRCCCGQWCCWQRNTPGQDEAHGEIDDDGRSLKRTM